ncbi:ATP-binding protein [Leadbettera azotonutricia]|uniref:ATPase with chaperone activity, ATP-binding domain, diverged n=1 Tax=Leadbettera azotonutricia (strain ATCC BAA-888 / DSM 13862 / ZAS-9) TaxID=545695 RepID=F5YEE6_LEAAZ|nr:ATP-binding protein [Leadbettera azotonutricia]AEF81790.1 ATPase with chaperone activity, ATP-binding domain, diverged [Leadbettera azotonutricia ZAS-9]
MDVIDSVSRTLADISGLSVFSNLRHDPLIRSFGRLLAALEKYDMSESPEGRFFNVKKIMLKIIGTWAEFLDFFIKSGHGSFSSAVIRLILKDENTFTLNAENSRFSSGKQNSVLAVAAANDLSRLGRIAVFDIPALAFYIAVLLRAGGLVVQADALEAEGAVLGKPEKAGAADKDELIQIPGIFPWDKDWAASLPAFAEHLQNHGAGELGFNSCFRWVSECQNMRPIAKPDPIRLSHLSGYEDQRSIVVSNTRRFISGKPANNLLLYGDRGTGKSATVKAVCSEYADMGLRLLEVHKEQLDELPAIMDCLSGRGLKFIIFIDDLAFENMDDSFTNLKALLEGAVETRPSNTVIYATTNRRHLVKENNADRPPSGDPRSFDTMQEQLSLADRFGLTVVYTTPDQEEYISIAAFIAQRRGLLKSQADDPSPVADEKRRFFRENALRWERWFNGRSPRTATQYVDWIAGGEGFPWE